MTPEQFDNLSLYVQREILFLRAEIDSLKRRIVIKDGLLASPCLHGAEPPNTTARGNKTRPAGAAIEGMKKP